MESLLLHLQVFYESLWLASLVPMGNDTALYAMAGFGNYNMLPAIVLAIIGGVIGQMLNYVCGIYMQRLKYTKNMTMSEDVYIRFEYYFRKYVVYTLVFSWVPLCKLLPLFAGFTGVPPRKVLFLVLLGYIFHYGQIAFGVTSY